jgi:hypothetical protein
MWSEQIYTKLPASATNAFRTTYSKLYFLSKRQKEGSVHTVRQYRRAECLWQSSGCKNIKTKSTKPPYHDFLFFLFAYTFIRRANNHHKVHPRLVAIPFLLQMMWIHIFIHTPPPLMYIVPVGLFYYTSALLIKN